MSYPPHRGTLFSHFVLSGLTLLSLLVRFMRQRYEKIELRRSNIYLIVQFVSRCNARVLRFSHVFEQFGSLCIFEAMYKTAKFAITLYLDRSFRIACKSYRISLVQELLFDIMFYLSLCFQIITTNHGRIHSYESMRENGYGVMEKISLKNRRVGLLTQFHQTASCPSKKK